MISKIVKASLAGLLLSVALNAGAASPAPSTGSSASSGSASATQGCHKGGGGKAHAGTAQHRGTSGAKKGQCGQQTKTTKPKAAT